jgi:hypothetical protein
MSPGGARPQGCVRGDNKTQVLFTSLAGCIAKMFDGHLHEAITDSAVFVMANLRGTNTQS